MRVAQLNDLHLGPRGKRGAEANGDRFHTCLITLRGLLRQPDLYLVTGDISDDSDAESYRFFMSAMRSADRPWRCVMGNHDVAANFSSAAAQERSEKFLARDEIRLGQWRVLCIDTSLPGLMGGFFDQSRADRLASALETDAAPTIIAMHHPPVASGVEWIDPADDESWIKRFGSVVDRFPHVRQILCGHVHMAIMTQFRGIPVSIAPATAAQLWPETAPFGAPDERMMVVDGQPGYALHQLREDKVITTFATPAMGEVRLRHLAAPRDGLLSDERIAS